MDATTLLITVYCLVDEWLAGQRLRQRGPQPILADREVLTIKGVGSSGGIDTDKGLYEHFRRHWGDWFPALGRVHRTTFVRQAANLWAVKAQLRQQLLGQVGYDPAVSILDSFPMPVCRFGRVPTAAGGWPGWPPSAVTRGPSRPTTGPPASVLARRDHRWPAGSSEPARPDHGRGAVGRGARLGVRGPILRDAWHLWSRWQRKLLSHTLAVYLCQQTGLGSLRFADLLTT